MMTGSVCNGAMALAMPPTDRFSSFHLDLGNGSALVILYLFVQRLVRYQREQRLLRRYRHETAASDSEAIESDGRLGLDLGKMTFTQASKIQKELASLEFPYTFGHSLELGFIQVRLVLCCRTEALLILPQTLAFPYPAKILNSTHQISGEEAMPKRLADTSVCSLLKFFSTQPLTVITHRSSCSTSTISRQIPRAFSKPSLA